MWHSTAVPRKWTIRALDKDHCVATWDQVLVQVWRLDTPLRTVTELDSITRAFMAEEPRRISSLAIIEATATPPDDAARSALSKFYRELGPQMGAAIVVAEGGGFRSSFVRGVGITLSALAPRALGFKFVGTVREAAVLLGPHVSAGAGAGLVLLENIDELRREISAARGGTSFKASGDAKRL
jgi:hypothetical protein